MARPEVIKTDMAQRLRDIRKVLGDPERAQFAQTLGYAVSTIANYERGDRVPDADVLAAYRTQFAVNANWVITGVGEMFEAAGAPKQVRNSNADVMISTMNWSLQKVSDIVSKVFKDEGIALPVVSHLDEYLKWNGELMKRADNPSDKDELESLLPWLEKKIRKDLLEAKAAPGTGKRLA